MHRMWYVDKKLINCLNLYSETTLMGPNLSPVLLQQLVLHPHFFLDGIIHIHHVRVVAFFCLSKCSCGRDERRAAEMKPRVPIASEIHRGAFWKCSHQPAPEFSSPQNSSSWLFSPSTLCRSNVRHRPCPAEAAANVAMPRPDPNPYAEINKDAFRKNAREYGTKETPLDSMTWIFKIKFQSFPCSSL